jgi:ribonuclease D
VEKQHQHRYSAAQINVSKAFVMPTPHMITTTTDLAALCDSLQAVPFITVDTEFMRESTYYPQLCLIQISGPNPETAHCIDPLADGIDLSPLHALLSNTAVLKVFHAARQDLEIFCQGHGLLA